MYLYIYSMFTKAIKISLFNWILFSYITTTTKTYIYRKKKIFYIIFIH